MTTPFNPDWDEYLYKLGEEASKTNSKEEKKQLRFLQNFIGNALYSFDNFDEVLKQAKSDTDNRENIESKSKKRFLSG